MRAGGRSTRRRASEGLVVALLALAEPSFANELEGKQQCIDRFTDAQGKRLAHRLREARELSVACAAPDCPSVLRKDCAALLAEIDAAMPTIVVRAKDDEGRDLLAVRVLIDGAVVSNEADGRTIALDPGKHLVRFEPQGSEPREQTIVLAEGDKLRVVSETFTAVRPLKAKPSIGPSSPATTVRSSAQPWPWITASLSVLALTSGVYFGLSGRSHTLSLRERCPSCTQDEVDRARRELLVADISFGVALVGAGVSAYLFATRETSVTLAPSKNSALALFTTTF